MPQIVKVTEDTIVVEDDGGFLNFIPREKPPKVLTPEEQDELNKKLDELGIIMF